ncbi:uncharacterized protein [Montipora capricornis]|uniref:uncharacterized protein n=1 Tax=Montipora foliosa TaxID=591990 RepID=UPI0035F13736
MGNSESTEKDKTFWAVAGVSAASEENKYNGRHEEVGEVAVDQVNPLEPAEIVEVVVGEDGSTKDILRKPGGSGVGPFGTLQPIALAVPSENLDAAAQKGHTSKEYVKAVKDISSSSKHPLLQFYTTQSLQSLGDERARVSVPIWISGYKNSSRDSNFLNVASSWFEHIEKAIEQINFAVPGLNLHIELNLAKAKVRIAGSNSTKCYTDNNILTDSTSEIYLYSEAKEKKRTSCHELFHALGVGHEHQRRDRDNYVEVESGDNRDKSYKKRDDLYGITQFDPFSIMLYPEDEKMLRKYGDSVWFTKSSSEPNREMSQLDKVGLNNLYRPCKHKYYSPKIGRTDLYYCGRHVGKCADRPNHDGYCGPDNGPNCPACRVLKTNRMTELWKQKKPKWQGWTGKVYCGDFFRVVMESHNGNCGPNNGPSCPTCYKELSNCH